MDSDPQFQPGEIVDIAIKGARILAVGSGTITVDIAEHKAHLPLLGTEVTPVTPAEPAGEPLHAHELSAADAAVIRMLAGATFGPEATVTLPSGRWVTGAEMARWVNGGAK